MSAVVTASVVAAITVGYLIALAAAERFRGAHHLVPLAAVITVVTSIVTTAAYLFAPLWWALVWIAALAAATPVVVAKLTRTYPRRRLRALLTQRLATVLGAEWTKKVSITFTPSNLATVVTTSIPPERIPSETTPRIKTVIAETLSGTWTTTTKGTRITATRKISKPDPPALRRIKNVVCSPKALTSTAKVTHYDTTDDDQVLACTVKYSPDIAHSIALGYRKRDTQKLICQLLDPGPGNSWSFKWETHDTTFTMRRSVFADRIDHTPPAPTAHSLAEAAHIYPDLEIAVGVDELEQPVTWPLVGKALPHGLFVGLTGSGKSSTIMTVVTAAARAGMCIIIIDFKCDKEYNGFRDWPNVHLVTQDIYSNLRAVAYVEELMNRRKDGGNTPKNAPPPNTPILLIIDEFTVCTKLLDSMWPQFRKDDQSLPKNPPTINAVGSIYREGRSMFVHGISALQRATADNIPAEFKYNSPFKAQLGNADSTTSYNLWDNAEAGNTIPIGVAGRGLTRGPNGFVQFQGYFTPDPAKATTDRDRNILDALRPPVALYPRVLVDMPHADNIERWDEIITAPIVSADSRPDLDPLSPQFQPRRTYRTDTTSSVIDAASMQLVTDTTAQTPDSDDNNDPADAPLESNPTDKEQP